MKIIPNHPLKNLNTFGMDVSARYFFEFHSNDEIVSFIKSGRMKEEKIFVLNGGSNILFTKDFDGLVIRVGTQGIEKTGENEKHVFIRAMAGVNWHELVEYSIDHGYAGLENLSMIPGNVGAAPIQNIGAYGVEQKDLFYKLDAVDLNSGEMITFSKAECEFGYRDSIFKRQYKNRYIVLSVTYQLNKSPNLNTRYGAIENELEKMGIKNPSIKDVSNAVCQIRGSKLPDPKQMGNAGSFFKNPVIDEIQYSLLIEIYPTMVAFPTGDGNVKIAAGWLIDHLGWKGYRKGDAGVCPTQALVLVNYGNATGIETLNLANEIRQSVFENFNIHLEMEVNVL